MKNLTLRNITRVCGGRYIGSDELLDKEVKSVITDSRKAGEGCLFVPIVGERVDGHSFIPQVMEAGALVTLSERELADADFPWILVGSSLQALKDIAAFYLEQLDIPVVGITGSVGKTSTKEAIAAVLSRKYHTLKTQGHFNNEIGVPLTVFRLREEDEIAVLEMGINHFGEMTRLARIARPDTAVITNIGTAHLEFLGDRDGILRAKTEMLPFVRNNGHIVLNGDDDKLATVTGVKDIKPVFFGLNNKAKNSVWADGIESLGLLGTRCTVHMREDAGAAGMEELEEESEIGRMDGISVTEGEVCAEELQDLAAMDESGEVSFEVTVPVPGMHMVYNALAAAAVGRIYGLSTEQIRAGIESIETIGGRMNRIRAACGLIVDDCYNANPVSMKASIDVMKDAGTRRVLILGDMGELGENEDSLHREVGAYAAASGAEVLLFVGALAGHMTEGAGQQLADGQQLAHFDTVEALLAALPEYIREGDTILVKASRFMKLEKVVDMLKEMPGGNI